MPSNSATPGTGQAEWEKATEGCRGENHKIDTRQGWVPLGVLSTTIPNYPPLKRITAKEQPLRVDAGRPPGRHPCAMFDLCLFCFVLFLPGYFGLVRDV